MADREDVREDVRKLIQRNCYASAQTLIAEHSADDPMLADEFARWYLDRGDLSSFHDFEEYCRAYALLPLGLPALTRERMLKAFVKVGFHEHAQRIAADLGRTLTMGEVVALVDRYTKGSLQSNSIEAELCMLAFEAGGELLETSVRSSLTTMHQRWKQYLA